MSMAPARPARWGMAIESSLALVGVLFLVRAAELMLHLHLEQFGIVPRTLAGLPGILFSPLLHVNSQHLMANALPLLVLLILLLAHREYHPWRALALIWGASGLGTWLIGRGHAVHIGASSLVFGLAAFLIVAGFLLASWRPVLVAALVAVCYGGIFYGALPHAGPVSWEGHLCGAVAGVWVAKATLKATGR
jgi:membrane associated rhomboid family serine protease